MYVNGSGFCAIERVMEVDHTTVIEWVKQAATKLPDAPEPFQIPEVAQLDELQDVHWVNKKQSLAVDGG